MEMIDAKTKVCVLLGNPVEHSLSPLIHNAGFGELGINCVYVALRVKDADLADAMRGIRALNIRGASITIPHKVRALDHVDRVDALAEKIGSINTVVNDGGVLTGFNSDGMGALKAFRDYGVELENKRVLMVGAGGAARAIAFSLVANARLRELSIMGIVREEVGELVDRLRETTESRIQGEAWGEEALRERMAASEIVINCTPVGMYPRTDEIPVPAGALRKGMLVFDVVYNPAETKLLVDAARRGCDTISGVDMFINQAAAQFELWTGKKAPVASMKKVVLDRLAKK
ncbi:MAG: shikimate dehydrogenase [Deltaproteobacteria bacterium]|nr:shikimate dehydrogenase [Deltaproteobacteria bacterium]